MRIPIIGMTEKAEEWAKRVERVKEEARSLREYLAGKLLVPGTWWNPHEKRTSRVRSKRVYRIDKVKARRNIQSASRKLNRQRRKRGLAA